MEIPYKKFWFVYGLIVGFVVVWFLLSLQPTANPTGIPICAADKEKVNVQVIAQGDEGDEGGTFLAVQDSRSGIWVLYRPGGTVSYFAKMAEGKMTLISGEANSEMGSRSLDIRGIQVRPIAGETCEKL